MSPLRRALLLVGLSTGLPAAHAQGLVDTPIALPRDFGAHPAQRIEWWYLTGWLAARGAASRQLALAVKEDW